jgi:hypothetical protein
MGTEMAFEIYFQLEVFREWKEISVGGDGDELEAIFCVMMEVRDQMASSMSVRLWHKWVGYDAPFICFPNLSQSVRKEGFGGSWSKFMWMVSNMRVWSDESSVGKYKSYYKLYIYSGTSITQTSISRIFDNSKECLGPGLTI